MVGTESSCSELAGVISLESTGLGFPGLPQPSEVWVNIRVLLFAAQRRHSNCSHSTPAPKTGVIMVRGSKVSSQCYLS